MALFQAESLIERGSTTVPQALQTQNFYGRYDLRGQPRSPYPAGPAMLAVPYVWLSRNLIARWPGVSQDRTTLFYLDGFGATLSSATFAAAAMAVYFLLLRRLQLSARDSLLLTGCVAFGTLLLPYSGYFFSEPLSVLLLLIATYLLFADRNTPSIAHAILAGAAMGFAGWVRPTMFLATGVFGLAVIVRDWERKCRTLAALWFAPMLAAIAYLSWNKHLFGRTLEFGYPQTAELGKQLNTFQTPFYVGMAGFLISPGKSVFLFFPLLVAAMYGIRHLWSNDRGLATVCAGLPLLYLFFYMRYTQWEGGYCPGPRYLLPSMVVSCVALAPLMRIGSKWRRRILFLAVLGFGVQIITLSTSFLEDEVGTNSYYDGRFDYRLSYNPLVTQTQRLFVYLGGKPAKLGLGFDRWFVFLSNLGIASGTLVVIALVPLLLAVWSFWMLRRAWLSEAAS